MRLLERFNQEIQAAFGRCEYRLDDSYTVRVYLVNKTVFFYRKLQNTVNLPLPKFYCKLTITINNVLLCEWNSLDILVKFTVRVKNWIDHKQK